MESSVAIVLYQPNLKDLIATLNNISKFSNAFLSWNSKPVDLISLSKKKSIDISSTKIYNFVNDYNLGIGGGLNIAFKNAKKLSIKHLLVLDQDSLVVMPKSKLTKYFQKFSSLRNCGCLGFSRIKGKYDEINSDIKEINSKTLSKNICQYKNGDIINYSYMHSGTLYDVDIFTYLKGFKTDFFMEYTDIEYSLRVKKNKFNLLYLDDPLIIHDAGLENRNTKLFRNFSLRYHPQWRYYLVTRNFLITFINYILFSPLWSAKAFLIFILITPAKILASHKSLITLLIIIFVGFSDGVISLFRKNTSLFFYNIFLEKLLKFKIPSIKKYF